MKLQKKEPVSFCRSTGRCIITLDTEYHTVGALIASRENVSPQTRVNRVAENFFGTASLDAVAVVEGNEPVGLVMRPKLLFTLFKKYGFELYGRKPIITIADTEPLTIHEEERLDVAMDKALDRPAEDIYDDIIIVDDGDYYTGLLSVKQMIIQQSNVLGNSIVQKEIKNERMKELEKINKMKTQFVANVSHDLRSPLNAILLVAELMKMSCDNGYIEQVKDRLSILISSANNLKAIVNNILDLSKIEAGKMDVISEHFDVVSILREVAETTRILVGSKSVDVEVIAHDGPVFIESDPVKVRQILTNLLSNASKFTERGRIVITLNAEDERLRISISDTGIGIKEDDLKKLFIAFNQLEDAKTKRHEGTGLGLTITKNLLNLLGGSISVSSKYGEGTAFVVYLPLKQKGVIYGKN